MLGLGSHSVLCTNLPQSSYINTNSEVTCTQEHLRLEMGQTHGTNGHKFAVWQTATRRTLTAVI